MKKIIVLLFFIFAMFFLSSCFNDYSISQDDEEVIVTKNLFNNSFKAKDKDGHNLLSQYEDMTLFHAYKGLKKEKDIQDLYLNIIKDLIFYDNYPVDVSTIVVKYFKEFENGLPGKVAMAAINIDWPMLFWHDGRFLSEEDQITIYVNELYSNGVTRLNVKEDVYKRIILLTKEMASLGDLAKLNYLLTYFLNNVNPVTPVTYLEHTIISVVNGGDACCDGFTKFSQIILNKVGIPTLYVTCKTSTDHALNYVKIFDKWYACDFTLSVSSKSGDDKNYNYEYYLMGSDTLESYDIRINKNDIQKGLDYMEELPSLEKEQFMVGSK